MLDNIQIVLVGITHPGNIGAAARAMKSMGLSQMRLVKPKLFPCAEATARAAGADDILANAQVFDNYAESLGDCRLIFATSARPRNLAWPTLTPKTCAAKALQGKTKIAIVFGREQSGLTNQELELSHFVVQIPTNTSFSSLNVAAAVQIFCYELKVKNDELSHTNTNCPHLPPPAPAQAMVNFYQHLEQTLTEINFLNPQKPKKLMQRLHRLFNRIQPVDSEVRILRGILTAIQEERSRSKEE